MQEGQEYFTEAFNWIKENGAWDRSFIEQFDEKFPQLKDNRIVQHLIGYWFEGINGEKHLSSPIKTHAFGTHEDENNEVVLGPVSKIIDMIGEGQEVRFNLRVKEVDYSGDKVTVTCAEGQVFQADRVILTVPHGVLKKGDINFIPQLPPAKRDAIENTQNLALDLFYLVFDRVFWVDNQQFNYIGGNSKKFGWFFNYNYINPESFTLRTEANGPYALELELQSDEEVLEEIMANLRDIYGPDIPYPIHFHRSKWMTNPNTCFIGTFAGLKSKPEDIDVLAESVDGKLFFAGDYTSADDQGYMGGAYDSGIREASKIISLAN